MKKRHLTADDLWKIQRPAGLSLSPDGTQAVCSVTKYDMERNTGTSSLWLLSLFGGRPRQLTSCGGKDAKDAKPTWSPDGSNIAFVAKRGDDKEPQLYLIAADGGEAQRLGEVPTGVSGVKWSPDGKRLFFISWVWPGLATATAQAQRLKEKQESKVKAHVVEHTVFRYWDHWLSDGRVPQLHVIDVRSGKYRNLFQGTLYSLPVFDTDEHDYDVSPDGRRVAFNFNPEQDPRGDQPLQLVELDISRRRFRTLLKGDRLNWHHPRYAPDGKRMAVLVNDYKRSMDDGNRLAIVDCASGKASIKSGWDRTVNHPLKWDADGESVWFTADDASRVGVYRWDIGTAGNGARHPEQVVTGGTVSEFDTAGGQVGFIRSDMSSPPRVYATADGKESALEAFNADFMAQFALGKVREFTINGWNREAVQMWVVYPPNFDERKKWPLLHSIHGGPHSNWGDNFHFRWNNQVFAAQGYVVVCVNYHGSLGWGNTFLQSNNESFGTKEHADVEAATDFMLKQGCIDADRLAASGGSYGGKMVAWMNGRNGRKAGRGGKDRYRAYICHAGCFDWRAMYGGDAGYWFDHSLGARYWDDPVKFAAQNPITEVRHAKTPTLILHGALDYRVPDQQGLAYYSTLKSMGVPTRLVFFPDENHWILKPQNARLWYAEYFAWLRRHLSSRHPAKS